ncbi:hypothetical protein MHF_1133 [Mycoplasma haemofelis Ohio2]|uniref:Uncharacterized protein n=1 Tax=Mycoplasma haemofelis (strain Ohio2) TaxID=859194 RepID=F6FJM1_MYCHI|nr:hypothetical protein MHF_1133 [Mycoplasma haemofelis Ohio2]
MSYELLKFAGLGGVATAAGGGITVGAMKLIESSNKSTPAKEELKSPEATTLREVRCVIYEAKKPEEESGVKKFKELLKKFESKEKFFEELTSRPSSEGGDTFKNEVSNACENKDGKKNVGGNVYVWYEESGTNKTWTYDLQMHGDTDWVKETGITKTFENKDNTV